MPKTHILETIKMAHNYDSAFNRDQLYTYLRVKMPRIEFDSVLDDLFSQNLISEYNGFIYSQKLQVKHEQRRQWSQAINQKYKFYIKIIALLPWTRFIGLTGSNSFESCSQDDDLDIFIISRKDRLWLSYLYIIIVCKLFRKRRVLCVNYLVDENNLSLSKKTYYTGVQLMQMIPVYNEMFKQKIIEANPWIVECLPNLNGQYKTNQFYPDKTIGKSGLQIFQGVLQKLNKVIFNKYYRRIAKKYPDYLGSSMILEEGVAKLHHRDHHDVYDTLNGTGFMAGRVTQTNLESVV